MRIPRPSRNVLGVLVSLLCLAAVVWWATQQEAPTLPSSESGLAWLGLSLLLYAVATLLRGFRWHEILLNAGLQHVRADAYALVVVGYMGNNVLPARGGEILRILLLAERTKARRREILGSVIAERLLDIGVLLVLLAALSVLGLEDSPVGGRALVLAGTVAAGLLAVLLALRLARSGGRVRRIVDAFRPVARASRLLLGRAGIVLALVTALIWLQEAAVYWAIGRSLELDLNLIDALFLVLLVSLVAALPSAPGYIGTFDAALIFGLEALDVTGGDAVAFVLLVRFVAFVPITIAGLALVLLGYGGFRSPRGRPPRADERSRPT